jgi:hypothetical protein
MEEEKCVGEWSDKKRRQVHDILSLSVLSFFVSLYSLSFSACVHTQPINVTFILNEKLRWVSACVVLSVAASPGLERVEREEGEREEGERRGRVGERNREGEQGQKARARVGVSITFTVEHTLPYINYLSINLFTSAVLLLPSLAPHLMSRLSLSNSSGIAWGLGGGKGARMMGGEGEGRREGRGDEGEERVRTCEGCMGGREEREGWVI